MKLLNFALLSVIAIANVRAAGVRQEKGIEYQPLPFRQYLDVVLPAGAGPFPAVVVLHGGGFHGGSRADVAEFCRHLAESGLAAVAVDYRMPPQQLFPAPLNDVKSAIRWLRANARRLSVDPERIGAFGFDAGGYLAVFAALTGATPEFEGIGPRATYASRIRCAVAADPLLAPGDMDEQVHFSFVGGAPGGGLIPGETRANALNWITPDAAPVLLLGHMPPSAKQFEQRMTQASVESAMASRDAASGEMQSRAISFLKEHLETQPHTRIVVADHGPGAEVILMDWPSGKEIWSAPNNSGHDAQVLGNGDVLVTLEEKGAVVEYDPRQPPEGNIVWEYGPAQGLKLTISAQRLPNGNTVIADTGLGKLVEIAPDGQVVWQYVNPDLAGNRMRHCSRTSSGTTLISVEAASKIIEVNREGKIVWSWTAPGGSRRPYQAKRLPDGNTLISLMNPGEVVEVNPAGEVLRSFGGNGPVRIGWASGFDLLPNGNLLVGDYTGQRLIEIDRSGKAVHELQMPHRPATVAVAPVSK